MATPSYNISNKTVDTDGGSSVTSATLTANAGSNRLAVAFLCVGAGSVAAHSSVAWGGASFTQRNSSLDVGGNGRMSCWYLKEADFPASATGTVVGTMASGQDEVVLFVYIMNDVDQTSPFRNASMTTNTGSGTNAASLTITSNAADLAVAACWGVDGSADNTGIGVVTGTSRQEADNVGGFGFESGGLGENAGGVTSVPAWLFTETGAETMSSWGMLGDSYVGATGGAAATRGTPFGHRGTAFNGGRTFHGIIQ